MSQPMARHTIEAWTAQETERLIQWLEEPENQRKLQKGSGITKRQIISEIAVQIPTKPREKVGYKYNNLLKSYREAVKLNGQSGWGLSSIDLENGKQKLRGM